MSIEMDIILVRIKPKSLSVEAAYHTVSFSPCAFNENIGEYFKTTQGVNSLFCKRTMGFSCIEEIEDLAEKDVIANYYVYRGCGIWEWNIAAWTKVPF